MSKHVIYTIARLVAGGTAVAVVATGGSVVAQPSPASAAATGRTGDIIVDASFKAMAKAQEKHRKAISVDSTTVPFSPASQAPVTQYDPSNAETPTTLPPTTSKITTGQASSVVVAGDGSPRKVSGVPVEFRSKEKGRPPARVALSQSVRRGVVATISDDAGSANDAAGAGEQEGVTGRLRVDTSKLWSTPTLNGRVVARDVSSCVADVDCDGEPLTVSPTKDGDVVEVALTRQVTQVAFSTASASAEGAPAAGDFSASPMSPASSWAAGGQSGAFTWSYPVRMPPAAGGLVPDVNLSYSSASVDGRTLATNNQASWVGDGFDLNVGAITRDYRACVDDMSGSNNNSEKTGDLCWAGQNASISFGGRSGRLVNVTDSSGNATNKWKLREDDGSVLDRMTDSGGSEYWRLTDTEGTQYYFGLETGDGAGTSSALSVPVAGNHPGEPCYATSFASSLCDQIRQWNLSYVVDRDGNATRYVWAKETNRYGQNDDSKSVSYDRGGYLTRIDYGLRDGSTAPAQQRVVFTTAERCLPTSAQTCAEANLTSATAGSWPDVPQDLICNSTTSCGDTKTAPAFFTRKRLTQIETQYRTSAGAYQGVDRYTLAHTFPASGDVSPPALWLSSITRTGLVGTAVSTPAITFSPTNAMPNRVDGIGDGIPAYNRRRLGSIITESGGKISVQYKDPGNTVPSSVSSNTTLNYPVKMVPESGGDPETMWFHTYPVESVVSDGRVGSPTGNYADMSAPVSTHYTYTQPAWHKDDNVIQPDKLRTYSQSRGFERVETVVGTPGSAAAQRTINVYYQGMPGSTVTGVLTSADLGGVSDVVADDEAYVGNLYESVTYNGDSSSAAKVSATRTEYARVRTTETTSDPAIQAGPVRAHALRFLDDATSQRTRVDTTYDAYGLPETVLNVGDVGVTGDETCATTTYARNIAANILGVPATVKTWGGGCSTVATTATLMDETQTYYDQSATLGAAPSRALPTMVKRRNDAGWFTESTRTYDSYGRSLKVTNALGHGSTTTYTPATAEPTTTIAETNAAGHLTTRTLSPGLGTSTKVVDPNGKTTTAALDGLGRVTKVWLPGDSTSGTPSTQYSYTLSRTGPSSVTTSSRNHLGQLGHKVETALLDGLMNNVQTQTSAESLDTTGGARPGRLITSHFRDNRGLEVDTFGPWYEDGTNPEATIVAPVGGGDNLEKRTKTTYDGAGRPTKVALYNKAQLEHSTTTSYHGDSVLTLPPAGQLATRESTDPLGRRVELTTYPDNTTAASGVRATFDYDAKQRLSSIRRWYGTSATQWSYEYDQLGNLVRNVDPDKGTTTSTYDDLGQQTSTTDARGQQLVTTYDSLGRKRRVETGAGAALAKWEYDSAAKGQLDTSESYFGGRWYTQRVDAYTDRYAPSQTSTIIGAGETGLDGIYVTKHVYWPNGALRYSDLPKGGNLVTDRSAEALDAMDRPIQPQFETIDVPAGQADLIRTLASVELDPYGRTTGLHAGSAGTAYDSLLTREYDPATDWLTEQQVDHTTVVAGSAEPVLSKRTYAYTPGGQVTKITENPGNTTRSDTQCFTHGDYGRLEAAWTSTTTSCGSSPSWSTGTASPYWSEWTYDSAWRRKTETRHTSATATETDTYSYPSVTSARPHGATSVRTTTSAGMSSSAALTYDDAGNTTGTPLPTGSRGLISWDPTGTLRDVTVEGKSAPTRNVPDADGGVLIRREPNGDKTLFLGTTEFTWDESASTLSGRRNLESNGEVFWIRRAGTNASDIRFTPGDHQGTPSHLVREDAASAAARSYTPFGVPRKTAAGWLGDHGWLGNTGATTSTENGLVHLGARHYDPVLGRFLSVDPVFAIDDLRQYNGYQYAGQDPVTNSDPSGLIIEGGNGITGVETTTGLQVRKNGRPVQSSPPTPAPAWYAPMAPFSAPQSSPAGTAPAWSFQTAASGQAPPPPLKLPPAKIPRSESFGIRCAGAMACALTMPASAYPDSPEERDTWLDASGICHQASLGCALSGMASLVPLGSGVKLAKFAKNAENAADAAGDARTANRAVNGETSATRRGREMHKNWDYGPGYVKEFRLKSGKRVDALNAETRHVQELKPNNPRAIRQGQRQVQGYVDELNTMYPKGPRWTGSVVTYGGSK
ncbi:RHS repeat-associated core domain-containing protein [Janibacter melonis]|uniref:RHS repeat-associated core domain-containing protein n=1 Tax=Janibacter melonis TaxID=262209 RepID=UPI001E2C827A|nr:RHS repeat-associated core domain-containing protein [Janibacter melonis]MCB5993220.1 hypothetical protein [Janibacter melonis]